MPELNIGDAIEWEHYPPEQDPPQPTLKTGHVVLIEKPGADSYCVAETEDGARYFLRPQGTTPEKYASGNIPKPPEPPAPAATEAAATAPEELVDPEYTNEPPNGAAVDRVHTPVGILYYGPAYHQAVDMLAEIFGPELKQAGHIPSPASEQDDLRTLYCFVIETPANLDDISDLIEDIGDVAQGHDPHGMHFGEATILTEEQVEAALKTTSELPLLKPKQ